MNNANLVDPAFDRDKFLMRQQHMAIREKYHVSDEHGRDIMFIERPRHMLRGMAAAFAGVMGGAFLGTLVAFAAFSLPEGSAAQAAMLLAAFVVGFFAMMVIAIMLGALRHLTIYRDDSKREPLLEVRQDKKFQPIHATFTVRTPAGEVLGRLEKNYLYNFIRKRWYCHDPQGRTIAIVKEDSIVKSVLRRFLGPLFGVLRTNFHFYQGRSEELIGVFSRQFTILDRYLLDLTADVERSFDRRLAVAAGIMLDTGERR